MEKNYRFAKVAYEAYCDQIGVSRVQLPVFEALKTSIQDAWVVAAEAVVRAAHSAEASVSES